ncbi:MAG: insulinase family protein [Candidatus Krumholzibacteriota bacterium]|nr:insulinase family protein [Candidatus Krumholzibacteriota bacterium]
MNRALFTRAEDIQRVRLADGAILLSQVVPDALSVSVGFWIQNGSRDEGSGQHGITHFLEHMVFKGTETRSALDIALAADRVGGQLDAFTTKELTCFNARVLAEYFDLALDLLADLLTRPVLAPAMVELEKGVVIEEIQSVLDDPDDWIHDIASSEVFGDHPLARPILGDADAIGRFTPEGLRAYLRENYTSGKLIVSVAGPLSHARVQDGVAAALALPPGPGPARQPAAPPPPARRLRVVEKDLQQQHLWLGRRGLGAADPDRYGLLLLGTLLGGSMSSRLFQAIREEAGLAYSVFSFSDFASDTGLLGTYMAVSPRRTEEALRRTLDEFVALIARGPKPDELEDTKMQLKGNLLLAMESVTARMNRLARNEINEGRHVSVDELVARIERVGVDDLRRLAAEFLAPEQLVLVSLGPATQTGPF